jgi:hypothetical protein
MLPRTVYITSTASKPLINPECSADLNGDVHLAFNLLMFDRIQSWRPADQSEVHGRHLIIPSTSAGPGHAGWPGSEAEAEDGSWATTG